MSRETEVRSRRGASVWVEPLESRTLLSGGGTWTALRQAPGDVGTMLLLTDGSVLASVDTTSNEWLRLTPDATGSYTHGTWSRLADARDARLYFGSQVLPDGRVFVAGGEYGTGGHSGETYDPLTNTWTPAPDQTQDLFDDADTVLLPDGRVMVLGTNPTGSAKDGAVLFDPAINTWSPGVPMFRSYAAVEHSLVKLADDSVLLVDGNGTSERYVPALDQWVDDGAVPVNLVDDGQEMGAGLRLPDGRAFFLGDAGHTALYTPSGSAAPGSWMAGPALPAGLGADDVPAALLTDGTVLCALGTAGTQGGSATYCLYDPTPTADHPQGAFEPLTGVPSQMAGGELRMLTLPDGGVLVSNGMDAAFEYKPGASAVGAATPVPKPVITSVTPTGDGTLSVAGTGLNGVSAGAAYGDDAQMDANYPIVRLTAGSSVYYARTSGWSSTGVGVGAETTRVALPVGLPAGRYALSAIANGVASDMVSLMIAPDQNNAAPTIATPASARRTRVYTAGTTLSVRGADDGGEANLTYTWTTVSSPAGAALPSFPANGTHAARDTTVTFSAGGTYTFRVYATDQGGLSTASGLVRVSVIPTETRFRITVPDRAMAAGATQRLYATAVDQFGAPLAVQPAGLRWHVAPGEGTVTRRGVYTAPPAGTLAHVTVSDGLFTHGTTVGVLGAPWASATWGTAVGPEQAYEDQEGRFTVSAYDPSGSAERGRFAYQAISGDVTITARVAAMTGSDTYSLAGVSIRAMLQPDRAQVSDGLTNDKGIIFTTTTTLGGGELFQYTGDQSLHAPYWVRLQRVGNVVDGYVSATGGAGDWTPTYSATLPLRATAYVGLFCQAEKHWFSAGATRATFDDVSITTPNATGPAKLTGTLGRVEYGRVGATLTNTGGADVAGPVNVMVYASSGTTFDAHAVLIGSTSLAGRLQPARVAGVGVPITLPLAVPAGAYHLILVTGTKRHLTVLDVSASTVTLD